MSPTEAAVLNGSSNPTSTESASSDAAQAHELAAELTTARGLLRFATAGSVDDGKSTLVGRLLHDSKSVLSDTLDAVQRTSQARGLDTVDLSLLVDGLRAEREQGITIDVAYRYFATPSRTFILADTPGHVQYTRNTVTGASTADLVVILTDARTGVVDQTRRHAAVAALLGVPHLLLAVNKIDLVDYDQQVFDSIEVGYGK
jgi:sulfate adenylyltransferase subunit 1